MRRLFRAVRNLGDEIRRSHWVCGDWISFLRLSADLVLYRYWNAVGWPSGAVAERTIRMRGGVRLTYRRNPGDIWSLREVWLYESYKLPFDIPLHCVVDLGANIGLTSVWLTKRYGVTRLIAAEPSPSNAELARRNLAANDVSAALLEVAVGSRDGTVAFLENTASNQGRVGRVGRPTPIVSMETLLKQLPEQTPVDLVKLDIEGGEQDLLTGDLAWLGRVRSVIAEFHPDVVDYPNLVARVEGAGFRFIPSNTVFHDNMDAFLREEP